MIKKIMGPVIDIHGGGFDLVVSLLVPSYAHPVSVVTLVFMLSFWKRDADHATCCLAVQQLACRLSWLISHCTSCGQQHIWQHQ